jgi:hypothetical protein
VQSAERGGRGKGSRESTQVEGRHLVQDAEGGCVEGEVVVDGLEVAVLGAEDVGVVVHVARQLT